MCNIDLLNSNRKIANEAMFKADPQAVVPRQTLNSLLNSAKAKINAVTSGDLGTYEYDIYQRPSQDSDTSSLTTNSDRELLPSIVGRKTELLRLLAPLVFHVGIRIFHFRRAFS